MLTGADHPLFVLATSALRMDLISAAVKVERRVGAHELQHRAAMGIAKCAFKVDLKIIGVKQQRLDGVGRLPNSFARVVIANRYRLQRMIDVEIPVDNVDEMDHQVG